jgi:hypothetical protein
LRVDPSLPRALVSLVLASRDGARARRPRARTKTVHRPLPRRLPSAIAAEFPPNILYRRYPLVTSLLVELDDLRQMGILRPVRRR